MRDFRMSSVPPQCCCCLVFVEDPLVRSLQASLRPCNANMVMITCLLIATISFTSKLLQLMYAYDSSQSPVMMPGNKNQTGVWAADRDSTNATVKGASSKASLGLPSDASEGVVLTPKNVHALRTLFNIAHRLHHLLGPAWVLVLDILNTLDRILQSPRTTTQVSFLKAMHHLCCSCCAIHAVLLMMCCSCCAAHAVLLCTSQAAWLAATCLTVTDGEADQQLGHVLRPCSVCICLLSHLACLASHLHRLMLQSLSCYGNIHATLAAMTPLSWRHLALLLGGTPRIALAPHSCLWLWHTKPAQHE